MNRYTAIDGCHPLDLMKEDPKGKWTDEADKAAARIKQLEADKKLIADIQADAVAVADERLERITELEARVVELEKQNEALGAMFDKDVKLIEIHAKEGRWDMLVRPQDGIAQLFAACFQEMFDRSGAKNFLEVGFTRADGLPLTVTIQSPTGQTPGRKCEAQGKRIEALDDALEDAVLAMEAWGREGDGIPEEGPIADAYNKARALLKAGGQ